MIALGTWLPELEVDVPRMCRVLRAGLRAQGVRPTLPNPYGPAGVSVTLERTITMRALGSVIVTQAPYQDEGGVRVMGTKGCIYPGSEWWLHASIAWTDQMPDYDDLAMLKDAVFGPERWAYQVFPPEARHVNIHEFALHLWGRVDGQNELPEFGQEGSI